MEPNQMFTVGLVPSQQLVSLLTDEEGNWRDVPEGQEVVPLVKLLKPEIGAWEPSLVWFDDRVERQWVEAAPPPAPTCTAEAWVAMHLSPLQVAALSEFRLALVQAGKPLGPKMSALKTWLEQMMAASVTNEPRNDWTPPPATYAEASAEAVSMLQAPGS